MNVIEIVLFDVGGVLVDLTGVDQMLAWTQNRHTVDELWRLWLESPTVRDFESGNIDTETFARRLVDEFRLVAEPEAVIESFDDWIEGPFPEVVPLLDTLRETCRLGTLSNTNERHWPKFIDEMGMGPMFDHHFPSHETGKLKPDRECFDNVIGLLGLDPDRILFLDDNEVNVAAARESGLQSKRAVGPIEARDRLKEIGLLQS